ncbi:PPA1309 family protein [Nocardioides sp.]|uniref:PPA1309 family protein n=1 Tax=Nocardioides sp. TaxID=35761 RepID=UPI002CA474D1|nr:PPA1309 family protein [Nocardioides sp.]HSX67835.1 PPA1309 family protein [Nocardioides sp.]
MTELPPTELPQDPALAAAVLEIESHVAGGGWDQPARLYALVETARIVAEQPELAAEAGIDAPSQDGSFTPVEQDRLPDQPLESTLQEIVWPPEVDAEIPDDPVEAEKFAHDHPLRQEVRIVAGATRAGATYSALRLRSHDDDQSVVDGTDLVPGLLDLLLGTLAEDLEPDLPSDPQEQ